MQAQAIFRCFRHLFTTPAVKQATKNWRMLARHATHSTMYVKPKNRICTTNAQQSCLAFHPSLELFPPGRFCSFKASLKRLKSGFVCIQD